MILRVTCVSRQNFRGRGQGSRSPVGPVQHRDAGATDQPENLGGDHELSREQQRRLAKSVHWLRPACVRQA